MKTALFTLSLLFLMSCNNKKQDTTTITEVKDTINIAAELQSIEKTRAAFQLAIKENRFGDLKLYGTKDVKSLTPICDAWEPFKTIRDNPTGQFHYDSLVMRPKETIIVSDSVAYDFGTSSTYYTNAEGEAIELNATFLAILKKDKTDGTWKLHREVANTVKLD